MSSARRVPTVACGSSWGWSAWRWSWRSLAGLWALDRGRAASHERTVARARELAAAANASLGDDPERSIHLALAAVETARTDASGALPEATSALHRAVTSSRAVRTFAGLGGWLDWSPDGTTFVTEGPEKSGLIDIRDAETGASLRSWKGHDDDVNQVAFSPDGTRLATAGDDGALRVWDPMTGALAWEFVDGEHASAFAPTFTSDGRHVLASWPGGGPVRTFDAASGTVLGESVSADVLALSASPDGQRVAFGQWDRRGVADGAKRRGAHAARRERLAQRRVEPGRHAHRRRDVRRDGRAVVAGRRPAGGGDGPRRRGALDRLVARLHAAGHRGPGRNGSDVDRRRRRAP